MGVIYGVISDTFTVTSDVPQEEHLSPLLFSIFVNNANRILQHAKLLDFADEYEIIFSV